MKNVKHMLFLLPGVFLFSKCLALLYPQLKCHFIKVVLSDFLFKVTSPLRASAHPRGVLGQTGKKQSFLKTVYLHCEKMILIPQLT